ncbi:MAG TPA: hypothetical protein VNM72_05900 [Blastocatellia bacterium]|nr:hypothetical protein [Blastocatellia bacterium]
MRFTWLILAALILAQVESQDLKQQGLVLFEQAEFALRKESDPARLAHGAIVLAGLMKDIDAGRSEALLRQAVQALSELRSEGAMERAGRLPGKTPRVLFRSPYDAEQLWQKLLEQSVGLRTDLVREFLAQMKAGDQWKADLLSRLARSVKDDEGTVSELVEMSLSYAISYSTVSLLFHLREKDPERGRAIFRSALARAARQGDLDGLYWLGAYAIPGINLPNRFPLSNPPPADPMLSRVYIRTLIDALSKEILQGQKVRAHMYRALINIRPYAEQLTPDVVSRIDSLLTLVVSRLPSEAIAEAEQGDLERRAPDTEKIEDLERKAQTATDNKTHDDLMAYAAFRALMSSDFERALTLASRLKDQAIRGEMTDYIHFRAAAELTEKVQLEQAEAHALRIEHPERLAVAVSTVLQKLSDKDHAPILIAQAESRIERLQTSGAKGRAFLYLAGPVMAFDENQGRRFLNRAIDLFNATKADLNGALDSVIRIETGEFATGYVIGSSDLSPVVIEVFKKLTAADPELIQAPVLAARWESAEIRAIAQAAVARTLLDKVKQRSRSP